MRRQSIAVHPNLAKTADPRAASVCGIGGGGISGMYLVEGVCGAFGELLYVKHDAVDRRVRWVDATTPQTQRLTEKLQRLATTHRHKLDPA